MCFADRDEFQAALIGLKLPYADEVEITDMLFDSMDFDGGGTLSQDEVVRYALLDILGKSKDRIRNLCKLWDADLSGTICLDEFRRVMNALGMEVPVATIDQLFADLDEDRTGLARSRLALRSAEHISIHRIQSITPSMWQLQ